MASQRLSARLMLAALLLVLPAAGSGEAASGREAVAGPVDATVLRVVDGDTVMVRARIWPGHMVETMVRLEGIDTPELTGHCPEEKALAQQAKTFLEDRIAGKIVTLATIKNGKFAGRVVARLNAPEGDDMSLALLAAGLARPYCGGRRTSWCEGTKISPYQGPIICP